MDKIKPIYLVHAPDAMHLVEASNKAQAIRHVVKGTVTAQVCRSIDVAKAMKAGIVLETAGEAEE